MSTRKPFWLKRVALLTLSVVVLGACGGDDDVTGPLGEELDPEETEVLMNGLADQFFTENEAVTTVDALAPLILQVGLASTVVPSDLDPRDVRGLAENTEALWDAYRSRTVSRPGLFSIPDNIKGTTWVFNPETGEYEEDPDRTGAPENGVRFILYAVDPITGLPIEPLEEIGHLDIIDTSTTSTATVQLLAVINGVTLIDLTTSATGSDTEFNLTADGFISDGSEQLDIDVDINATSTETDFSLTVDVALSTSDLQIDIQLDFSGTETSGEFSLVQRISDGNNFLEFRLTQDLDTGDVSGEVRFGEVGTSGDIVAIITIDAQTGEVNITNAEGGELSQAELEALEDLFMLFEEVLEAAFGVVELALVIVGFGFV